MTICASLTSFARDSLTAAINIDGSDCTLHFPSLAYISRIVVMSGFNWRISGRVAWAYRVFSFASTSKNLLVLDRLSMFPVISNRRLNDFEVQRILRAISWRRNMQANDATPEQPSGRFAFDHHGSWQQTYRCEWYEQIELAVNAKGGLTEADIPDNRCVHDTNALDSCHPASLNVATPAAKPRTFWGLDEN